LKDGKSQEGKEESDAKREGEKERKRETLKSIDLN